MTRFNLICHGMMLFTANGNGVRILIPSVPEHSYKFGAPKSSQGSCQGTLSNLPPGSLKLTGPPPAGARLVDLVPVRDHLVLKSSSFEVVASAARTTIDVPMPDLVRMYRPVEVSKRLNDVFGSSSTGVAHGAPTFLHDVVCLSYLSVPDGTAIRLGALVEIVPASVGASLCIYAQDEDDSGPDVPHTTGINDLLSGSAGRPDLNLSRVGEADGAPEPAFETAVDRCELRNLIELRNDISRTGRTGCTGCFLI